MLEFFVYVNDITPVTCVDNILMNLVLNSACIE